VNHPVTDLSMNETPYPPLPSLSRLVEREAARLNRYPDHTVGALRSALAGRLAVPAERIVVGPGSAGLAQHLIQALGPDRDEVVYPSLSFEAYPLMIANAGARPVPVGPDGLGHDLAAMAAAVTGRTRAVLVCNPNNPTGTALRRTELLDFLDRIPPDVVVVIDEAYREFVTDPDVPDGVALLAGRDNVCVLRTFSKAYGLAALRIGYAVAPPRLAVAAGMLGALFFPTGPGQLAATAALEATAQTELAARCADLAEQRTRLRDRLTALGLPVPPSQANFLWLPLGGRSAPFVRHCRDAGILVRGYPEQGVRVTVGAAGENDRLVTVAGEFLAAGVPAGTS
jgi:histidinol-phosphate aminotransferase